MQRRMATAPLMRHATCHSSRTIDRPASSEKATGGGSDMADVLFVVVTIVSFALLILFVYGCEKA